MKLEEAIKDLQARVDGEFNIKGLDNCEDIKLGIEALKFTKSSRDPDGYPPYNPPPGETEE